MQCSKRKKAFTLTELLVVVIVLGVLAGVAAPKFKRVLESRKTTEAENMLSAVRTEQEKRCIMGKNYLTDVSKVEALANASTSKNYTYSLTSSGATAASKGASDSYSIKMLSYKNGSFCCEGTGCDQLNKNYPSCEGLTVPDDECKGKMSCEGVIPSTSKTETVGSCIYNYSQTVSCNPDTGVYEGSGFTQTGVHCECEGEPQTGRMEGKCLQERSYQCNSETGSYTYGEWSNLFCECDTPDIKQTVTNGDLSCEQTRSTSCDTTTGTLSYGEWINSKCTCNKTCGNGYSLDADACECVEDIVQPECSAGDTKADELYTTSRFSIGCSSTSVSASCGNCGTKYYHYECQNGTWATSIICKGEGVCSPGKTETVKNCSNGTTITHTCTSSCTWGANRGTCPTVSSGGGGGGCGLGNFNSDGSVSQGAGKTYDKSDMVNFKNACATYTQNQVYDEANERWVIVTTPL